MGLCVGVSVFEREYVHGVESGCGRQMGGQSPNRGGMRGVEMRGVGRQTEVGGWGGVGERPV